MNADLALKKLIAGNKHYVESSANDAELSLAIKRQSAAAGQKPWAVILGCSDSRVPAELVFNCGLGELFVIRVAGNIIAPSQIGSVEFACQHFGTQLVVVLGHSHCGAIKATVDTIIGNSDNLSPNLASIVDRVIPAVRPLVEQQKYTDKEELIEQAIHANIKQSVSGLQIHSSILHNMVGREEIKIIGAEYSIETGEVHFHDQDSRASA